MEKIDNATSGPSAGRRSEDLLYPEEVDADVSLSVSDGNGLHDEIKDQFTSLRGTGLSVLT